MSFADIRDQEVATRLLRRVLIRDRIPNGMFFWGPGGVGKRLTALEMAKAINCQAGDGDACGTCLSCRKVMHGNHPDVKIVAPTDKARMIKKDQIDEVNEIASLRPYEALWRIIIILEADRLNLTAQNHFLKTLEEPPGRSLFILVSEHPRQLLPTIRSRCQMVRFRSLNPKTVSEFLQRDRGLAAELADSIAALAQGQMTRALDLVDSEKRDAALSLVQRLSDGEDPVALAEEFNKSLESQKREIEARIAEELNLDDDEDATAGDKKQLKEQRMGLAEALFRRDLLDYLYLLETWYRDELVYGAAGSGGTFLNKDRLDKLRAGVSRAPDKKIAAIERARVFLDRYINEERVFRDLFFALAAD